MCEWEALHSYVRFIEKSRKRKNFVLSGNSFYIASDGLYSIGRIGLICNISLSVTRVNRKNIGHSSEGRDSCLSVVESGP